MNGSSTHSSKSIEQLHSDATMLAMETRTQLDRLVDDCGGPNARIASGAVAARISELAQMTAELDARAAHEARGEAVWPIRIKQLGYQCQALRDDLARFQQRQERIEAGIRERALRQRELLGDATPFGSEPQSRLQSLVEENDALGRAHAAADEIEEQGVQILSGLERQRLAMAGMRRKLGGLIGKLGLSRKVMGAFESRNTEDKWLVYGGMLVIVVLIVALFFIFR